MGNRKDKGRKESLPDKREKNATRAIRTTKVAKSESDKRKRQNAKKRDLELAAIRTSKAARSARASR